MSDPGAHHWKGLKWILRYLRGNSDVKIEFSQKAGSGDPIIGYVDADFASNVDTRRSQTGYVFTLFGAAVSWKSQLLHNSQHTRQPKFPNFNYKIFN